MKNKIIICFSVMAMFFGFSSFCSAATIFTDNFNSYTNGAIGGQGGWTGASGYTSVVDSPVFEGAKAVSFYEPYPGSYNIEKTGTLTNDGRITMYVRGIIGGTTHPVFVIKLKEGATDMISAVAYTGFGFYHYDGDTGTYATINQSMGSDTWYAVQIEWRSSDHKARYRIDNGNFTDWHKGLADWSGGLDTVNIGLSDGAGYVDAIQENPSTIPFVDDFNSYSGGGLVGQGGWTNYPGYTPLATYSVESLVTNEGAGALAVTGPTDNGSLIYKTGAEVNDGTMTFYFKATDTAHSGGFIFIGNGTRIFFGVNINQSQPGYVAYLNGSYGTTPNMVDTANVWHYVQMQWRSIDHTGRYSVDGGVWTEYVPSFTAWDSGGVNSVVLGGNNTSGATLYFDTFQESMIPKTPVLIVPGLMGTELKQNDTLLWADVPRMVLDSTDSFMDPLAFNKDLTSSNSSIFTSDVITSKFNHDYTGGLINEFKNQGYVENQTLFTFPYDWRYGVSGKYPDGRTNADLLQQKIAQILQQTGASKVDVVAHSLGGLIVKQYAANHLTDNHIGKAVFVGVPSTGAVKSVKTLLQGDSFDISFAGFGLSEAEIKKISENMPATYDLLPSQRYYDTKGSFIKVVDQSNFTTTQKDLTYPEFESYITGDHGLNNQAMTNAQNLHTADFDNFDLRTAGVDLYAIDGCKTGTVDKMVENRQTSDLGTVVTGYRIQSFKDGDNTVPIESATNLPIDPSHKFYSLTGAHSKMLSQDASRQQIVNLISGSNLSVDPRAITQDFTQCGLNGKAISVFSPVNILVTDQNGNRLGNAPDGSVLNEIPNGNFEIFGDSSSAGASADRHKFLYLPTDAGQTYNIQLQGTGAGTYTITSQTIAASQVAGTEVFSDLPVTTDLTGQVNLGTQTTLTILQTPGGVSQTILPSSTINGQQSQDVAPPMSTATISGKTYNEGQWKGQYKKDATITISAQDAVIQGHENETSGILNVAYNLDSTGVVKMAGNSATIVVEKEGSHKIEFLSIDKAGNREAKKEITFAIKKAE